MSKEMIPNTKALRKAKSLLRSLTALLLSCLLLSGAVFGADLSGNPDDYADTFEEAKSIACGAAVSGKLDSSYDADILSFTTDGGQNAYTINVSALDTASLEVTLYDEFYAAGKTIEGGSFIAYSGETTARGFANLAKNKTYYVKISRYSGSGGKWQLLISKTPDDAGNDFDTAKPVAVSKKITGKFEVDQDIDFYAITLPKKNNSYWIDVRNTMGTSQMIFVLYAGYRDLSSRVDAETSLYRGETVERSYKLTGGKTYYLKIYGASVGCEYSFMLSPCAKTIKKQKPANFRVQSNYARSVYVSFENNKRYDGVELWRSTSKSGGFKKVKVLSNEYFDYDDLKTKKKVTYYYKARYFVKDGKKKLYGKWTKVKGGKHKN